MKFVNEAFEHEDMNEEEPPCYSPEPKDGEQSWSSYFQFTSDSAQSSDGNSNLPVTPPPYSS